ncbi:hypothetical protein LOZ12_005891 [Ophidiomyces ophidiicola]|uniref:Uncharacterized protein n=1 Tax=Ophidiomyces ophidiicola TaxID=1387563 RepID=A0ACB8UMR1_9EURO|nr:hypothetical protein LOZ64_006489 [Ophidiomyces ophidiicola]KAI1906330.1 hypothetical protein LOZ61_006716 [Ophidiomyces ophidiicola]KAI1930040.1 hypothetical protein LOZ60_001300 [Ophidiomyces ophidiicola]KAI1938352.1 hypothetical protein LOZ62_005285 [Ophidiomyces ophidiicola]KAI1947663.1 hypothetical protein LOZ59_006552 [Ophidiomyces ophidiicola]
MSAAGQLDRRKSLSSSSRSVSAAALMPSPPLDRAADFEPCAATASLFLCAHGSTVLALHHDTLAVDRSFDAHTDPITFIAADNVSESGAGRLVVSYDASQTAIIWDLFTGQEVVRFASFEVIRVAAWMRNGNIAFGSGKGDIILFEPSTSEHISARTIFDPITALAPAADCQSHAIGYQNGSILIATLQPFTILHTLSTSRAPSPIVSLAWHASSTKQKSDMLATQTVDGDLLVWSVSKLTANDLPRVIRTLRRPESTATTPKWLAWSKNGRIVQYSDSETWAWDVRTKHVTYERIPTIQGVRGIANYGPTATLFTLGPNHTVQQYDLLNPMMVANVQHIPGAETSGRAEALNTSIPLQAALASTPPAHVNPTVAELKDASVSPSPRSTPTFEITEASRTDRPPLQSPESISSNSLSRHYQPRAPRSLYSGTTTTFSTSSPVQSGAESVYSMRYTSSASIVSGGSLRGTSRLRNEYIPSSVDEPIADLFPFIRSRLNEVPFRPPPRLNEAELNPDELRKQMLNVVFGWEGDILDLLHDELRRHRPGDQHSVILGRWLGHVDYDILLGMASSASSRYTGWMLLALSTLNTQLETKKMGHTFVQKLLARGDIHAAVAILIGMGDGNDGVEVYVSRNMYMEATLLTCLVMPTEWARQSYLVRRWGEYVVQNSQQHLAIRCFSCTDTDNADTWASPSVQMANILSNQLASKAPSPLVVVPPSDPKPTSSSPKSSRPAGKQQALKLITSFGPENTAFRFPGLQSADRTPINMPGVTPIESAMGDYIMSPAGSALYKQKPSRPSLSARTITPGGHKNRLPSIGETPTDVNPPSLPIPKSLPTPDYSGSEREKEHKSIMPQSQPVSEDQPLVYLTSARYTPRNDPSEDEPKTSVPQEDTSIPIRPTSKADLRPEDFSVSTRNGSRDRKPEGLHIKWPPVYSSQDSVPSSGGSLLSQPLSLQRREGNPIIGVSPTWTTEGTGSLPSGSISGRSVNDYISSLDAASYYSHKHQNNEFGSKGNKKGKESRGRSKQRYIQPAKRSPSSPVPMSPEDFALYSSTGNESTPNLQVKESKKHRSRSDNSRRRASKSRGGQSSRPPSRNNDNADQSFSEGREGRRRQRDNSFGLRSPSSPVPMSPSESHNVPEDNLRLVSADRNQRLKSSDRGSSRRPERGTSARRDSSPDRRKPGSRSRSRQAVEQAVAFGPTLPSLAHGQERSYTPGQASDGAPIFAENIEWNGRLGQDQAQKDAERIRKEQAAAELEARRLSLVRRPSAPVIPLPGELSAGQSVPARSRAMSGDSPPLTNGSFSQRVMGRHNPSPAMSTRSDSSTGRNFAPVPVGLPATPRAMRHPKYSSGYGDVPPLPDSSSFDCLSPVSQTEPGRSLSISRSMSAPIPEDVSDQAISGIPAHPHFQPQLPSSRINKSIGHRKELSQDGILNPSHYGSFSGQSGRKESDAFVPPVLPELQHLSNPPPPPPAPSGGIIDGSNQHLPPTSEERNSLISGVGTINIAIDEPTVLNAGESPKQGSQPSFSPTEHPHPNFHGAGGARSSMAEYSHRRGRSINDGLANKIRSLTDRMRSTSRGRNMRTSPTCDVDALPYESVPMTSVIENTYQNLNKNEF